MASIWTFENDGPGARSFEVRSAQGDGHYGGGAVIDQGGHETVVLDLGPGNYVAMSTWVATGTRRPRTSRSTEYGLGFATSELRLRDMPIEGRDEWLAAARRLA